MGEIIFIYTSTTNLDPRPNTEQQTQTHLDLSQYPSALPIIHINKQK